MDAFDLKIKYEQNTSLQIELNEQENFNLITVDHFNKICRTCLSEARNLRSIYDATAESICVGDLFQLYASMQVIANDFLPQNICNICVEEFLRFHTFKQKCDTNEKILRSIIDNVHISEVKDSTEVIFSNEEINLIHVKADEDFCDDENTNVSQEESFLDDCEESNNIKNKKTRRKRTNKNSRRLLRHTQLENKNELSNKPPFKCRDCDDIFSTRGLLKEHRNEAKHGENRNHSCNICGKMFTSSKLKQHMRAHTKEKPYICKVCSQGFSMSGNLKRHIMTHTGERPHVCEICGKGFIQATTLATHHRTHENTERTSPNTAPNFICDYCGRGFKRLARYNAHLKRHFSDAEGTVISKKEEAPSEEVKEVREYICAHCKRAYKTKHLLKAHQLTHGEKTFLCSECGKGFVTKAALQSHLKIHTGEKPHTCNVCKKSFAHVGSFEAHMLIHTGQKPYNCNICTKAFTQLSHLKYHLRTHSGERPYICSYCGKSFALKGNLTVHVRIHTGETPYSCPICGKGFYDSSSMKKHRRGHGEINTNSQEVHHQLVPINIQFAEHQNGFLQRDSDTTLVCDNEREEVESSIICKY